ncbi:MAG TPA: hypothetical protein VHA56_09210 [Mucilaginibacter sp.]|nr:hypothetical protein [Mucilaginibacter sp.]
MAIMAVALSLFLSLLALLATYYQAHLQRVHNGKSVKPLIQITLTDDKGLIFIHIQNNGLGPAIVERLTFIKNGQVYHDIKDSLTLNPSHYQHIVVNEAVNKVILPGTYLEVFSKQFDVATENVELDTIRNELATIKLTVEGRDIYDKKIETERDLIWFLRHL